MESFFFLVPIALVFVAVALRVLFWAINSGQYDNLDTEAHRILFDEDGTSTTSAKENTAATYENEKGSPELKPSGGGVAVPHKEPAND